MKGSRTQRQSDRCVLLTSVEQCHVFYETAAHLIWEWLVMFKMHRIQKAYVNDLLGTVYWPVSVGDP